MVYHFIYDNLAQRLNYHKLYNHCNFNKGRLLANINTPEPNLKFYESLIQLSVTLGVG